MDVKNTDLAARLERNFINSFRPFSGTDNAILSEDDVSTSFFSDYSVSWMNCVMKANGSFPKFDELVTDIVNTHGKIHPLAWRIGALTEYPDLVRDCLLRHKFKFTRRSPAMVLDVDQFRTTADLSDCTIKLIDCAQQINDYVACFAEAFPAVSAVVADHLRKCMQKQLGRTNYESWFVAYQDKTPVCSASYLIDSEIIMIYNVATRTAYRSKGYGRAITEAAINHALHCTSYPIGLYSSDMGYSLYRKIGFTEIGNTENYVFSP